MPDRCPGQINWHSDRAGIIADGVVHAIGTCLGLVGAVTIVVMAVKIERINVAPILVYVIILSRAPTSRISGPSKERELSRDSCDCPRSCIATPRRRVSKLTNAHHPGERWCAGALEHLYAGRPRDCDV